MCLLALAALASHQILSFDVFWQLRAGQEILRTGALPAKDPFSYTSTVPWMNHEWLSHVLLALLYQAAGFPGLVLLQVVFATGITLAMATVARMQHGLAVLGLALFGGVLALAAEPRAQMIYWACFAATLWLCARELQAPSRRILWTVPLGILGANLHGGNPTSMVLLGILFLARPSRKAALLALLGFATTLANPYGYGVHSHFLGARHALPELREWMSLGAALALRSLPQSIALLLGALALGAFLAGDGLRRLRHEPYGRFLAIAFVAFGFAAFRYARFTTEWSFLSVLLVADARLRLAPRRGVLLGALALTVLLALTPTTFGFGLSPQRFPQDAVAYLQKNQPPGPMFNSYNFGGYLLWAYPQEKVFIDGRAFTVYSESHFEDVVRLYQRPESFRELESRHGLRLAVLQRQGRGAALFAWLCAQPDWQVVHLDPLAAVLRKTR